MFSRFDRELAEGILYTDQYQLVMAQLYFRTGIHKQHAQFDHFFRDYPDYGSHKVGYVINAGMEWLLDWMENASFGKKEIEALASLKDPQGEKMFDGEFLKWLEKEGNFSGLTIEAIPEGRVVHAGEPLTVVRGPIAMAQILETALLNQLNFQCLIATKACRIKEMGRGNTLLEFGARRGHDRGVNAGVRGALIGGADFSSNVGISLALGYPPKGTHAHSMVQYFLATGKSEYDAFLAFAEAFPNNTTLLVDTIDTLNSGVPNAIRVFEKMKERGQKPFGVRLDSGDLAYLSIQTAKILNKAGFEDVKIVLSNQLDEMNIWQIISQIEDDAPQEGVDPDKLISRLVYGVGTNLITSKGAPTLDGVYKLVSVKESNEWIPAIKISETREKIPNPGYKNLWRIYDKKGKATADLITLKEEDPNSMDELVLRHPVQQGKSRILKQEEISKAEPILETVYEKGKRVKDLPSIDELREKRIKDLKKLDSGVKRLINPHQYHVSLSEELWKLKEREINKMKEKAKQN